MIWPLEYTYLKINEEVLAMLGRQSDPDDGDHPYLDHVRRDSFYGFLASHREELFRDEDFTDLYCSDLANKWLTLACNPLCEKLCVLRR